MKSIHFQPPVADDMVRAILEGRETVTRRVVQMPDTITAETVDRVRMKNGLAQFSWSWGEAFAGFDVKPTYRPGDILYVRETFWKGVAGVYEYKADYEDNPGYVWTPSIHMPREAARIFLRVKDVRVERLQDSFFRHGSTIFSLMQEGIDIGEQCRECIEAYGHPCCIDDDGECGALDDVRTMFSDLWNDCYAKPQPVRVNGVIKHYESYPWEDIRETRTYRGKPWYVIGNSWVWVIEFERCEKPEGN